MRKPNIVLVVVITVAVLLGLGVLVSSKFASAEITQSSQLEESAEVPTDTTASSSDYEITEGVLLSDDDIAKLCDAIASNGALTTGRYAKARGTGELNLSVAGPVGMYWLNDSGEFELRSWWYLIFDNDEPILLVHESFDNEANNAVTALNNARIMDGVEYPLFKDILTQSTTRKIAVIMAYGRDYLYDGVNAEAYDINPEYLSNPTPASITPGTSGIEVVELVGIDVRQHFDF